MRFIVSLIVLAWPMAAAVITGTVRDPDGELVAGATVRITSGPSTKTGADGAYRLEVDGTGAAELTVEFAGFVPLQQPITLTGDLSVDLRFNALAAATQSATVVADGNDDILNPDPGRSVFLHDEMLDANPGRPGSSVSIPGLPTETASGGIKAPQYFSPGVAGDHGEPIAQFFQIGSYLIPNNLSANAHGNGYADPNVLMPAAIESVEADGGAFNVREGNHAMNLTVAYGLRSRLDPVITVTGDAHDLDVMAGWSPSDPAKHAWIAVEASYGDGLLKTPEHRKQIKLNGYRVFELGQHQLTLFGTGYYGGSRIPGLVPIAEAAGLKDTIDPRQREQTHTAEIAANDIWRASPAGEFHFSGFFRTYNLSLFSNFGDGLIRQSEFRTVAGGEVMYVRHLGESWSLMAGVDTSREAPRQLDLDHYTSTDPMIYGPFQKITANNVTLDSLSPYVSLNGRLTSWLRVYLGWRRDEIHFENTDLLVPTNSFYRWVGVNSPKATLNVVSPQSLPLPSVSFSFGESFFTNDPRIGLGSTPPALVDRAHSWQILASKTILGTDVRIVLGYVTEEQSLAKIDPDTGLQFNQGPSRNRYITLSARHRFGSGMVEASLSKADARDLLTGGPLPEAPRLIFDVLGAWNRLPFRLQARGEYEEVGPKPLGDGFTGVAVRELRGAVVRSFCDGRLKAGINVLIGRGYAGQTTEVLALPGESLPFEQVVGVRIASYVGPTATFRF